MGKLTRPQIWIIFSVLSVIAMVATFFLYNKPLSESIDAQNAIYAQEKPVADQHDTETRNLDQAKKDLTIAKAKWDVYDRRFMPRVDITDLYTAWKALTYERVKWLGPNLEKFVRDDKSVQVLQASFSVQPPPDDPNQANGALFVESGSVQVAGTFNNILKHVERWNQFKRLAMVTGFQLSGNSPQLVGQYGVQIFEFTQGDKPKETYPAASATGGGGFGGGFGGGSAPGAPMMPSGAGASPMGGGTPPGAPGGGGGAAGAPTL